MPAASHLTVLREAKGNINYSDDMLMAFQTLTIRSTLATLLRHVF